MGTHEDDRPAYDGACASPAYDAHDRTRATDGGSLAAYDAVILAGGSARRFGGADKVLLPVAGQPMLERVLAAVGDARTTVVVGPERRLVEPPGRVIRWTREVPPGSGPLAALAVGLTFGSAPVVVVLAGDMPMVSSATVAALVAAVGGVDGNGDGSGDRDGSRDRDGSGDGSGDRDGSDDGDVGATGVEGAVLVDDEGRRQPLAAAYLRVPLQAAMATIGDPRDQPMRRLSPQLRLATVSDPTAALDCDTPEALTRANDLAAGEQATDNPNREG